MARLYQDGLALYTDHNNLISIFDPLEIQPDIGLAYVRMVLRWSVRLYAYRYVYLHISSESNVWADLLSHWCIPLSIRRLFSIPLLPSPSHDFDWPDEDSILEFQDRYIASLPACLAFEDDLWRRAGSPIWIPNEDGDLQMRLAVIFHFGAAGHCGTQATELDLRENFVW